MSDTHHGSRPLRIKEIKGPDGSPQIEERIKAPASGTPTPKDAFVGTVEPATAEELDTLRHADHEVATAGAVDADMSPILEHNTNPDIADASGDEDIHAIEKDLLGRNDIHVVSEDALSSDVILLDEPKI